MKRISIIILTICLCVSALAQPVLTRSGSYTYVAPSDKSVEQAKQIALERAKVQILEDQYGTVVGVSNISRTANKDGESSSTFLSIGETEVKGEWLRTVGQPKYAISLKGETLIVKVTMTGKIREITQSKIELETKILANGIIATSQSEILKDGDRLFISFKSPADGFVAVYQYDRDGVFRLLPYKESEGVSVPVKAGKEYIFFPQIAENGVVLRAEVDGNSELASQYIISCEAQEQLCRYYVIFSPNRFAVANDSTEVAADSPALNDFESFQKWIGRVRKQDKEMVVAIKDVTLQK